MNPMWLASKIFGAAIDTREFLYAKNILPSYDVGVPVLSIGNLTFGGTGKTPTCDFLLNHFKTKKVALISRGYGRQTKGFFKVDPSKMDAAKKYGDEPTWLAKRHPEISVYVCEDRVAGCKQILKEQKVDLILADDAFQHLRLQRKCDVVIVDATETMDHYEYPPSGRARNAWKYLERADAVFITKTNLATHGRMRELKEKTSHKPTFEFEIKISDFTHTHTGKKLDRTPREVYLLSGIGKNWTFHELVKKEFSFGIKKHFEFEDHHSYTQSNIKKIESLVGNRPLLVTQKDAVKLKGLKTSLDIYESQLEMVPLSTMERFYALLD